MPCAAAGAQPATRQSARIALLTPELDATPHHRDRSGAAGGAVGAELVVEVAGGAVDRLLERAVDIDPMCATHIVHGVDANRGADGRSAGEGLAALHRVKPAAALDGEHEVRAVVLVEGLLETDAAAGLAGDPEVALELPRAARVGRVAALGTLVAARGRAGQREGEVVDVTAAALLDGEGRRVRRPPARLDLGARGQRRGERERGGGREAREKAMFHGAPRSG